MFKKLLEHNITSCDEQFFCHLCMSEQSNLEDALHHINEEKHQLLWLDQTVNILKDCEEQTYQILRDNKIAIIALSSFNCTSCCHSFQDLISTLQHVQNKCHIDQLKNKHVLNCDKDNSKICIVSVKSKLSKVRKKKLDSSDKSMLLKDTFIYKDTKYDSYVFQGHSKYVPFEFFRIVYNYSNEDCQTLVNNRILKFEYYQLMCQYCYRCCLTPSDILQHIMAAKHTETDTTLNERESKEIQHIPVNPEIIKNVIKSNLHEVKQNYESKIVNLLQYISVRTQQEQNINKNENLSFNDIICELCKCHLPSPDHILPHMKGRQHVSLLAKVNQLPQSMEENDNNNTKLDLIENKYTSQITAINIPSKKSKTKDHQSNLKFNIDCKICTAACTKNCLKKYDEIFLSNNITIEGSKFICKLCDRICNSLYDALQHINGKIHTNKLKHQNQISNKNSDNDGSANQKPTINFTKNKMNVSVNEKWSLNDTPKQEHLINIEEKDRTNEIQDNSNNTNAFNKSLYFCELCSIQIDITNLHEHINTVIHKCNIPTMSIADDIFLFKCFCCKSIIQGTISLITHLNATKHLNNLKNILIHIKTNNTKIFPQSPDDTQSILKATKSVLCSVLFPKMGNEPIYLSEKCLISFDTSNIVVCDDIKNKIMYSCLICRVTLNTAHNLIEHCRARMHLWRIKQFSRETLNYSSNTLNCPSNKMGEEQINTTTDNCFDITSDICAQITDLLHVSPFKPKLKTKYDYKGQKIIKRLNKIYCEEYLEIEEKMYTLNKKKLNDVELNFKLFMPYNRKNFYCLACDNTVSKELDLLYEHACLDTHKIKLNTIKKDADSEKLIKQYMQKNSEDSIKCHICRSCFKNDTNSIDAHINDKMHKKRLETFSAVIDNAFNSITQNLTNLWYSIQKFSCVPCTKSFNYKMEFIEHIATHTIHSTKEIFDFCIPCATLWLDTKDCYTSHCNDVVHKYLIKSKDFMVEDLPECIKKLLEQVDKISDVLFEQTQILMNDTIQKEVTQSLESILKSFYPSIKAFLFGSRITGLGTVNSDIDIYLDCGMYICIL